VRTGRQGQIKVWVNGANILTYGAAVGATRTTVAALNEELGRDFFHKQGLTTELSDRRIMPIRTDTRMLFYPTGAYGEFLVLGVFLIAFQQLILISLPFSVGLRRETDPVSTPARFPFASLAGRVGAHTLFYILASLFIVLVVTPSFGWGIKSATSVLVLFAAFGLAMLPLSMIAASLVRNRFTAFQVLMFASTPVFMVSGFTWPLEQMPRVVQVFASVFPATPALLAMRVLAVKTSDLAAVSSELAWLGGQFAAYTALAVVVTHLVAWRDRRKAPDHPTVTTPVV
jgi:ABC-2 type transport system permease protein